MKIAAFDIDGTVLFEDGIAPDVVAAIRDWQAAGHLAVAATGKSRSALDHALRPYDLRFDYDVIYTGAVLADARGDTLSAATLPVDLVRRIITELLDVPGIVVFATMLGERDALFSDLPHDTADTTIIRDFVHMDINDITDDHQFVGIPLWVLDGARSQHALVARLAEDFPEVDVMPNQMFIDLLPTGVSKGAGLGQLISHLGMERTEVTLHTFGDSWNDLSIHAIADRSYAFPWSPDEVMEAADEVIESVAPVLRRLA